MKLEDTPTKNVDRAEFCKSEEYSRIEDFGKGKLLQELNDLFLERKTEAFQGERRIITADNNSTVFRAHVDPEHELFVIDSKFSSEQGEVYNRFFLKRDRFDSLSLSVAESDEVYVDGRKIFTDNILEDQQVEESVRAILEGLKSGSEKIDNQPKTKFDSLTASISPAQVAKSSLETLNKILEAHSGYEEIDRGDMIVKVSGPACTAFELRFSNNRSQRFDLKRSPEGNFRLFYEEKSFKTADGQNLQFKDNYLRLDNTIYNGLKRSEGQSVEIDISADGQLVSASKIEFTTTDQERGLPDTENTYVPVSSRNAAGLLLSIAEKFAK